MSSKVCSKCLEEKDLAEFHRDSLGYLGHKSSCKKCVKEKDRLWHLRNREKNLAKRKEYRLAHLDEERRKKAEWSKRQWIENREHISRRASEYHFRNQDKRASRYKEWYKNNKSIAHAAAVKRHTLKKKALPAWANLEKIKDIYRDRQLLSEMTGVLHHVDHIIPLQGKLVSGLHVEYNLRIIPASENLSKNNQFLEELL